MVIARSLLSRIHFERRLLKHACNFIFLRNFSVKMLNWRIIVPLLQNCTRHEIIGKTENHGTWRQNVESREE